MTRRKKKTKKGEKGRQGSVHDRRLQENKRGKREELAKKR